MIGVSAVYIIVVVGTGLIAGVVIGFFIRKNLVESRVEAIEKYSKKVLAEAQKEAKTTKREAALQAKDTLYQMKVEFEKETKEKKDALLVQEKRLLQKTDTLDKKIEQLENREERISEKEKGVERTEKEIRKKEGEYKRLVTEQRRQLERSAGISAEEAKQILINTMELEAKHDAAKMIRRIENEARSEADRKSQEIIALAVKDIPGIMQLKK